MEEEKSKEENKVSNNGNYTQVKQKKLNKNDKNFIIQFIIVTVLIIIVTGVAIYFSINYINDENIESDENVIIENVVEESNNKKVAEDKKYAINSYTETYNENSLNIKKYYDIDGEVTTDRNKIYSSNNDNSNIIEYVQINGLLNETIEKQINDRLKSSAYNFSSSDWIYSNVYANFSNVLSVTISGLNENTNKREINTINIDLATGEDIPFEKVFVSSAPLNSYLVAGLFEALAWQTINNDEEAYAEGSLNMDNVDTSDYEDKGILLLNNYKDNKNKLKYYITENSVVIVDGLIDKKVIDSDYIPDINISFINNIEEIAIYKRYLTNSSIFKSDSIGEKNLLVLIPGRNEYYDVERINFGKISDNIFEEEAIVNYMNYEENDEINIQTIKKYIQKLSEEQKQKLLKQDFRNQGVIFQREYIFNYIEHLGYYEIYVQSYQATCSLEYYKEGAFRDYALLQSVGRVEPGINGFTEYKQKEYPNMKITNVESETYYLNKEGELIGRTEEEVKEKLNIKDEQEQLEENNAEDDYYEEKVVEEAPKDDVKEKENSGYNKVDENEVVENNIKENKKEESKNQVTENTVKQEEKKEKKEKLTPNTTVEEKKKNYQN